MSQLLSKKNSLECMTTEDSKFVLFPADGFSDEQVTAMQSARSSLPRDFQCLSPILEKLLTTFENRNKNVAPRMKAPQFKAATDYKVDEDVVLQLGLHYDMKSVDAKMLLKDTGIESKPLDPSYARVIDDLYYTKYVKRKSNESISRTMLDLVILDRLNKLNDEGSHENLRLIAEVPLAVHFQDFRGQHIIVRGRADRALGYGAEKPDTDCVLLVVEAKSRDNASTGMAQLLVYMAAAHQAREDKKNRTVFGMLSDAKQYSFARLDNDKNLSISRVFVWHHEQDQILRYLDIVLRNAIESSSHTTPLKIRNPVLYQYPRYLCESWESGHGEEGNMSEEFEPILVDVVKENGKVVMIPVRK